MAAVYEVDTITHRWNVPAFEHLARCKQLLLDYAVAERFDYIFLVDSDLLLEPSTLRSLYAANVDVVSGVFWTQWTPQDAPMPQCWLRHPYGLEGLGMRQHDYIGALQRHQLVRVIGGGACTLIKTRILDRVHYHPREPLPPEGMWQGEDRTFAVLLQHHHIHQYADAWPRIHHAYHLTMRTQEALDAEWAVLHAPPQLIAKVGDWINVNVTAMEDLPLQQHIDPRAGAIRGRLGAITMAPEIEEELQYMHVGDRRIVDYTVPPGHSSYPAGLKRAVQLHLVDVRPHGAH